MEDPPSSHRLPFELFSSILLSTFKHSNSVSTHLSLSLLSLSSATYSILLPSLYSSVALNTEAEFLSFQSTIRRSPELGCLVRSLRIGDETLEKSPLEETDRGKAKLMVREVLRGCSKIDYRVTDRHAGEGNDQSQEDDGEDDSLRSSNKLKKLRLELIERIGDNGKKLTLDELSLEASLLFFLPPFDNIGNGKGVKRGQPIPDLSPVRLITSGSSPRPQLSLFLRSNSISIAAIPFEGVGATSLDRTEGSISITRGLKEIKLINVLGAPNRILRGSETLSGQLITASYDEAYGTEEVEGTGLERLRVNDSFSSHRNESTSGNRNENGLRMPRPGPVVQEVKLQSLVKELVVLLESSTFLGVNQEDQATKEDGEEKSLTQIEGGKEESRSSEKGLEIILQGPKGWGLEKLEDRLRKISQKGKVSEEALERIQINYV